jgi:hypothetical protein
MTRELASEREPQVRVLYRISWNDVHDPFKAQNYCIEFFFLCHEFFALLPNEFLPFPRGGGGEKKLDPGEKGPSVVRGGEKIRAAKIGGTFPFSDGSPGIRRGTFPGQRKTQVNTRRFPAGTTQA